jgi:hypothetical protein
MDKGMHCFVCTIIRNTHSLFLKYLQKRNGTLSPVQHAESGRKGLLASPGFIVSNLQASYELPVFQIDGTDVVRLAPRERHQLPGVGSMMYVVPVLRSLTFRCLASLGQAIVLFFSPSSFPHGPRARIQRWIQVSIDWRSRRRFTWVLTSPLPRKMGRPRISPHSISEPQNKSNVLCAC